MKQQWKRNSRVFLMALAALMGGALVARSYGGGPTKRSATSDQTTVVPGDMAGGAAQGPAASEADEPKKACEGHETPAERASRVVPILATKMALKEEETKGAIAIMTRHGEESRKVKTHTKAEVEADKTLAPEHDKAVASALALNKKTQKDLDDLLGSDRGKAFYRDYFRSDPKVKLRPGPEAAAIPPPDAPERTPPTEHAAASHAP